jgi:hypothetical protein
LFFCGELDIGNFDAASKSRKKEQLIILKKFSFNRALKKIFNPNSSILFFYEV